MSNRPPAVPVPRRSPPDSVTSVNWVVPLVISLGTIAVFLTVGAWLLGLGGTASPPRPAAVPGQVPVTVDPAPVTGVLAPDPVMQSLADRTMEAAGPINDPAIPDGTVFIVSTYPCNSGTGQQSSLEVWFIPGDLAGALDRVADLWAADGYSVGRNTDSFSAKGEPRNTDVEAVGIQSLPANHLSLDDRDGTLRLSLQSNCTT